jgi:hypothetical protein
MTARHDTCQPECACWRNPCYANTLPRRWWPASPTIWTNSSGPRLALLLLPRTTRWASRLLQAFTLLFMARRRSHSIRFTPGQCSTRSGAARIARIFRWWWAGQAAGRSRKPTLSTSWGLTALRKAAASPPTLLGCFRMRLREKSCREKLI